MESQDSETKMRNLEVKAMINKFLKEKETSIKLDVTNDLVMTSYSGKSLTYKSNRNLLEQNLAQFWPGLLLEAGRELETRRNEQPAFSALLIAQYREKGEKKTSIFTATGFPTKKEASNSVYGIAAQVLIPEVTGEKQIITRTRVSGNDPSFSGESGSFSVPNHMRAIGHELNDLSSQNTALKMRNSLLFERVTELERQLDSERSERNSREDAFFAFYQVVAMTGVNTGWSEALKSAWNALMHAMTGNVKITDIPRVEGQYEFNTPFEKSEKQATQVGGSVLPNKWRNNGLRLKTLYAERRFATDELSCVMKCYDQKCEATVFKRQKGKKEVKDTESETDDNSDVTFKKERFVQILEYVDKRMRQTSGIEALFLHELLIKLRASNNSDIGQALKAQHNKQMHSVNGNIKGKKELLLVKRKRPEKKTVVVRKVEKRRREKVMHVQARRQTHAPRKERRVKQIAKRKISKEVAESDRIAASLALPKDISTIRYAGDFTTSDTAVANPFDVLPLSFYGSDAAPPDSTFLQLPQNETFGAIYRNILCSAILYTVPPTNDNWSYDHYIANYETESLDPSKNATIKIGIFPQTIPIAYAKPSTDSSFTPHGTIWFPGYVKDDTEKYFWYDDEGAVNVYMVQSFASEEGNVQLRVLYWNGRGPSLDSDSTILLGLSAPNEYPIARSGYYCFQVYGTGTALDQVVTISMTYENNGSTFGHRCMPFLEDNAASVEAVRIQAASFLVSETAAPINKQGKVTAKQIPRGENWQQFAASGFRGISKLSKAVTIPVETGMYGFLKPSSEADFAIIDDYQTQGGVIQTAGYPLLPISDFLIFAVNVDSVEGRDMLLTLAFGLEYETTDPWRQVGSPKTSPLSWRETWLKIREMEQFYENPTHWRDIFKKIASHAKTAIEYVGRNKAKLTGAISMMESLLL